MRFLQKINIYLYIFALILFICLVPRVFAYENTDTTYTYNIPDYKTPMQELTCANTTLFDYVNYIIDNVDFSTSSYQLYIPTPTTTSSSKLMLYLVPSNVTDINIRGYHTRYNNSGQIYFPYNSTGGYVYLYFSNCSSVTDMYSLPFTTQLINRLQNGTSIDSSIAYKDGVYNYSEASQSITTTFQMDPVAISNTSNNSASIWFYYSSKPLVLNYNDNNNDYYYKKLYLNYEDITINKLDYVPSYYDLYVYQPDNPTYIGYQDSLKTFYTSLDPTNVSSYQLKTNFKVPTSILGFSQDPQDYINNTSFEFVCGGRVDNTNYYTYDSFNCSLSSSYSITDNYIEYTFNNLNISNTITGYDKIFVTIKTKYLNNSVSTTLYDYSYTYNLGSFYNTDYKGAIYENFTNLPLNFKLYLSSNNSLADSNVYIRKYNFLNYNIKYVGFSNTTNQQTLVVGSSILGNANDEFITGNTYDSEFIQTNVTNSTDTGIMIYQENGSIVLPDLSLFFNGGIVLSFNNTSSDDFYYIDNTGTIQNNTFTKPIISDTNDYDISYYISQVNGFIDSLSADSIEFASLTQNFYNGLPQFFQVFVFIIFILFCVYFTYLLIKK